VDHQHDLTFRFPAITDVGAGGVLSGYRRSWFPEPASSGGSFEKWIFARMDIQS
jgi:hypothetical protein